MTGQSPDQAIGARIRFLRKERGWNQTRLAEEMTFLGIGWHQQTVARTENGERAVRLYEVQALAQALDVEVSDFLAAATSPEFRQTVARAALVRAKAARDAAIRDYQHAINEAERDMADALVVLRESTKETA